jgi:MFS family permease
MTGIRGTTFALYANTVLGLDQISIGTILTYASLTNLLLTMPVGYLVDYYGRKIITWIALFLSGISCLIYPFTTDYFTLSLASIFMGIATIGSQQAPMAMVTDATDNEPRGISLGVFRFFGDIAFILGPITTGLIADSFNLSMPFYFMAVVMFISAIIVAIFGVETYSRRKMEQNKNLTPAKQ